MCEFLNQLAYKFTMFLRVPRIAYIFDKLDASHIYAP